MPRVASITTKGLRELQAKMKRMETAIEPKDVNPILAAGMELIKADALQRLRAQTKRTKDLPPGWEHIDEALVVEQGKSTVVSRAFAKVFRRRAPQAIWIEYGHGGPHPAPAYPFFRPAIKAMRTAVRRLVNDGIKKLIENAAKG